MSSGYRDRDEEKIASLAVEFREGSDGAFKSLYQEFHSSVYRFCLRMLRDPMQAKDSFQETFIKAFEHRSEFRGDNFPAWLFTIARRVCLNAIRARRNHDSFDETFHGESFSFEKHDVVLRALIEQAVNSLTPALRESLILRDYEGYSYQQIAEIAGIELSLAKVRVHRARLALRSILEPIMQERFS